MRRLFLSALTLGALLLVPAAGGSLAAQTGGAGNAGGNDALAALEQAVMAKPDDLRAANDYRMAVVKIDKIDQYDRTLAFFQGLVTARPTSSSAHLNYGFAYVDKIPVAGSITQVILANNALGEFTKAIELQPSWIGLYTRGNSYLFWPRIFNRTHLGVADLEAALKMQRADTKRSYHVRVFIALGDGYWKMDDAAKARATWQEGLAQFPDNAALKARLSKQGDELQALFDAAYDPNKRVDTSLKDLWTD
jgi:tetratricopeptide (TPR) repeat protein